MMKHFIHAITICIAGSAAADETLTVTPCMRAQAVAMVIMEMRQLGYPMNHVLREVRAAGEMWGTDIAIAAYDIPVSNNPELAIEEFAIRVKEFCISNVAKNE